MFGWMLTVYTTLTKLAAEFIDFISQLHLGIGPDNIFDDDFAVAALPESDDSPDLDLPESDNVNVPDLVLHLPESDDSYAAWFSDD